jgi:ankyrin repeat protein
MFSQDEFLSLLNENDSYGANILHYISGLGYHEVLSLFKHYDLDMNSHTNTGLTPLVISAARGHEKVVKKLISLGAEINVNKDKVLDVNDTEPNPIEHALMNKHHDIAELLLRYVTLKSVVEEKDVHHSLRPIRTYKRAGTDIADQRGYLDV